MKTVRDECIVALRAVGALVQEHPMTTYVVLPRGGRSLGIENWRLNLFFKRIHDATFHPCVL